jgi:hypothetical protein
MPPRLHLHEPDGPVVCLACARLGDPDDPDPWTTDVNEWMTRPDRCCDSLEYKPQARFIPFDNMRR